MGYCILTIKKIKSYTQMQKAYKHNYRGYYPANIAPWQIEHDDELVPLDGQTYTQAWEAKIQDLRECGYMTKAIRKDAVLALEIVTTFSREEFENVDIEAWKRNNVKWLNQEFNLSGAGTDNVVSCMYHGDEVGNVHIHSLVIPIDEKGHLNAKRFVGGKSAMIHLQNSYAEVMKREHNLDRGLEGSTATHQDIKKFYTKLNNALYEEAPTPQKKETMEMYYGRVKKFFAEKNLSHLQETQRLERRNVETAASSNQERLRLMELEATQRDLIAEYEGKIKKLNKMLGSVRDYAVDNDMPINEVEKRLKSINLLMSGIKHMENKDKAAILTSEINSIIQKERERQHRIKKDFNEHFDM